LIKDELEALMVYADGEHVALETWPLVVDCLDQANDLMLICQEYGMVWCDLPTEEGHDVVPFLQHYTNLTLGVLYSMIKRLVKYGGWSIGAVTSAFLSTMNATSSSGIHKNASRLRRIVNGLVTLPYLAMNFW
jgi:hypothetical protein